MVEIYPSSIGGKRRNLFPWDQLEVGQSFPAKYDQVKGSSLRTYACIVGKKLGRQFSVKDHGKEVGIYEVARIK